MDSITQFKQTLDFLAKDNHCLSADTVQRRMWFAVECLRWNPFRLYVSNLDILVILTSKVSIVSSRKASEMARAKSVTGGQSELYMAK